MVEARRSDDPGPEGVEAAEDDLMGRPGRSQQAAEQFPSLGFTDVFNLAGGIDAWSQQVDSNVPRY